MIFASVVCWIKGCEHGESKACRKVDRSLQGLTDFIYFLEDHLHLTK